jgi:response regulator RpfG family c-di-GMP phosphodiesterase
VKNNRVLIVDDDEQALALFRRSLRKHYHVESALTGSEAVRLLDHDDPFGVVVADLRMPEMDGLAVLRHAREIAPETVRILLSGEADVASLESAINSAAVHRFLSKACQPDELRDAVSEAVSHYQLITEEKSLLSSTVSASMRALIDIVAMATPEIFERCIEIRPLVGEIAKEMQLHNAWHCEVASLLCKLGCVAIREASVDAVFGLEQLGPYETAALQDQGHVAADLIGAIPSLSAVAEIVRHQDNAYVSRDPDELAKNEIPVGSRILKAASDYVAHRIRWNDGELALATMELTPDDYDPQIVELLVKSEKLERRYRIEAVGVDNIPQRGFVYEPIKTETGEVVFQRGEELSLTLCQRLNGVLKTRGLQQPLKFFVLNSAQPDESARTAAQVSV